MHTEQLWNELEDAVNSCRRCPLYNKRNNTVLGEGSRTADIIFVGEGPGYDEDRMGRPFVGKAGQLLDKMFAAINLKREEIYIGNIVKCRPPGNRIPTQNEAEACLPYLRRQVYLIKPKIIVCLGSTSAKHIIDPNVRITKVRGRWIERKGFYIMPTYHPAALLRDASKKKEAWVDLQMISKKLKEIREF